MEIPVYLFTGFLDSGKTKFIQETLADPKFFEGPSRTLVILFEDGEEELDPSAFASDTVFVEILTEKTRMNPDKLSALQRKYSANRVMIEYNGMWLLPELFSALPDNWTIYQEMSFADSESILGYNANMRNLVVDKISTCELIVFNRCTPDTDKDALHKLVRTISRRCDIIYESTDGTFEYDDIVDPLPFDVNADNIEIGDEDFALWYRDLSENMQAYDGKTVSFLGMVAKNPKVPKNAFVIGRHIMTCCVDDTVYSGLLCEDKKSDEVERGDWVRLTAKINIKPCTLYGKTGPVLERILLEKAEPPKNPIATFY